MTGFDREALAAEVQTRGAVVRVVIAGFRGSTPRETGAAMLVWDGGQSGTIGGGALEYEAARAARRMLGTEEPWARVVMKLPLGPALGQCCGGHVTLLLERFGAMELTAVLAAGGAGFVRPVISGVGPEGLAAARLRKAARSGEGGAGLVGAGMMVEPFAVPVTPLWLYGAGHVGRAIVRVAEDLPIAITWVDTARERFPEEIPAHAAPLVAADPARVVGYAPEGAMHLVLTYSHALDLDICHAVLGRSFGHLGLIGSASKRGRFLSRLRALGHSEAALARLRCPIGDRGLGKQPAAIALGVVTEVLRLSQSISQTKVLQA